MTQTIQIAKVAASYGYFAGEAKRLARAGRTADARWYAKHARADFRSLCSLAGQPAPRPHRLADDMTVY
jgi:hypothetical protein